MLVHVLFMLVSFISKIFKLNKKSETLVWYFNYIEI